MNQDPSPLDTLRQLKEWLDAGTITPEEFQTLKQKLVFSESAPAPESPAPTSEPPAAPAPPVPTVSPAAPLPAPPLPPAAPEPVVSRLPPLEVKSIAAPEPEFFPASEPKFISEPEFIPAPAPKFVAEPAPPFGPEPTTVAPVEMAPLLPPVTQAPAPYATTPNDDGQEYVEDEAYIAPRKSPLMTIVVVAAVLALLALVAYLYLDNRDSERLTSTSRTEADSVAVQPEIGPQTEQIELPPVAAPETVRVEPVAPPVVAPPPADTVTTPPAPTVPATASPTPPTAAAPVLTESGAKARVESILQRYYTDLQAAPFAATAYFAPQVERFYLMQNTTPAAINAELARTHFPEFLEGQTTIRPGTLQVSAPVADGSRVVTYVENSTAFRQSLQKHQQTAAQVRLRFDKDFKIVYLRQEKLLENNFTD